MQSKHALPVSGLQPGDRAAKWPFVPLQTGVGNHRVMREEATESSNRLANGDNSRRGFVTELGCYLNSYMSSLF